MALFLPHMFHTIILYVVSLLFWINCLRENRNSVPLLVHFPIGEDIIHNRQLDPLPERRICEGPSLVSSMGFCSCCLNLSCGFSLGLVAHGSVHPVPVAGVCLMHQVQRRWCLAVGLLAAGVGSAWETKHNHNDRETGRLGL